MRIVCDTNVLISALLWGGTPGRILERIETGRDTLYTSYHLLQELAKVLNYPKISRILERRNLSSNDILELVIENAQIVETSDTPIRIVPDDPDDDHVIECAITAHADFIVTGDSHLLDLNVWKLILILSAGEYLQKT
ncbi:MAG: putative toxin-antitoxin system toxin component, PIN family [Kiritimatiellae bacterium]|jgi:putative PIN family toxin of toxin-antitoxin system|nr:putative toxin-antitoxin system toxin component, PIN family [Kiritimatiellia bacterium]